MAGVGYIEPPKQQRRRKSSLDEQSALRMAELLDNPGSNGRWVSDQLPYPTKKQATARAQGYRKLVAILLSLDPANVRTRVWQDERGRSFFALAKEVL